MFAQRLNIVILGGFFKFHISELIIHFWADEYWLKKKKWTQEKKYLMRLNFYLILTHIDEQPINSVDTTGSAYILVYKSRNMCQNIDYKMVGELLFDVSILSIFINFNI